MRTTTLLAFLASLTFACGDDPSDEGSGSDATAGPEPTSTTAGDDVADPDGSTSGGPAPGTSSGPEPGTSSGPGDTTDGGSTEGEPTTGDTTTGPAQEPPPTNSAELVPWLEAGEYLEWAAESGPHASAGPHGMVRTFMNDALIGSFEAGLAQHPEGAAAVKELYTAGGQPNGWAVMVKVQPDSAGGAGWYWYETLGGNVFADGTGEALCTGCHSGVGMVDFVLTPFPLQ